MTGETRVNGKRFVFAGNRFYVLEEMLAEGLDLVQILAVENSYLQRVLTKKGIEFTVIESKKHLVSVLAETAFDIFLANGCPFILPISRLSDGRKTFLNVHPSPLPDLRGTDPVPGSLLHGRDSGATCHVMDDGVDTGPIIARVPNGVSLSSSSSLSAAAAGFSRRRNDLSSSSFPLSAAGSFLFTGITRNYCGSSNECRVHQHYRFG